MSGTKLEWNKVFKEIILGKSNVQEDAQNRDVSTANVQLCKKGDLQNNFSNPARNSVSTNVEITKKTLPKSSFKHTCRQQTMPLISNLTPSNEETKDLPEWEKVFKDILGDKPHELEPTDNDYDYIPPPVPYKQVKSRTFYAKRKPPPSFKSKRDKEAEEEVRKDFERWRMLRKQVPQITLNDFDGAGINIFKYSQKSDLYSVPKQCNVKLNTNDINSTNINDGKHQIQKLYREKLTLNDFDGAGIDVFKCLIKEKDSYSVPKQQLIENSCNIQKANKPKDFEPYVPLTGAISVTPYKKNNPSSRVEQEECWDDDCPWMRDK